jgi:hypothetical protein
MRQAGKWSVLAALAAMFTLAACAPGSMVDGLPSGIGLPAGTPARPAAPYQYPAVHDMPPSREAPTMSAEQQDKLEKELTGLRERQEASEKKASPPAKKKPAAANSVQPTGPKANP